MNIKKEYENYSGKIGDRKGLYSAVVEEYSIKSALYPGSHIDIAPSLVIVGVTYVDNFRGTHKFFQDMNLVQEFIESNKEYSEKVILRYFDCDYSKLELDFEVDLIISQYAGFVGQETKKYLREGGILLCNDSHGDATLAYLDDEYELIGVIDSQYNIVKEGLEVYFKFARSRNIDVNKVKETMKGPKYKIMAENYIFRKNTI